MTVVMKDRRERGQALVEFSLAIMVFLTILMAVFDFGRAVYQNNGVAQAAREIARSTSVHPGSDFTVAAGRSSETNAVIATQKGLIPNLQDPTIVCVDIMGTVKAKDCLPGDWVRVTIAAPYSPIAPFLGLTGTWNLSASSSIVIQGGERW
jgi:Flp pilus assembly protein TadG